MDAKKKNRPTFLGHVPANICHLFNDKKSILIFGFAIKESTKSNSVGGFFLAMRSGVGCTCLEIFNV